MWERSSPCDLSTSESDPQNTPRWKLHKADWDAFRLLCQDWLQHETLGASVGALENFSITLLGVTEETIPKTSKQTQRTQNNLEDTLYLGLMILARWRWLNVNKTFRHSSKIPPTLTYQTYVSFKQMLTEPFDETNVTVGYPVSLNSIGVTVARSNSFNNLNNFT